jgi:DNA repair protein RadC
MPPAKITQEARALVQKYPPHVVAKALLLAEASMAEYKPLNKVICAVDVVQIVIPLIFGQLTEHLIVLCVNRTQQLLAHKVISIGGTAATIVEPKTIFRYAVENNAAAIILVHNHPSGNPLPSVEDKLVTERIVRLSQLLGVPLLDHIIVCDDRSYVSMVAQRDMAPARFGTPPATGTL